MRRPLVSTLLADALLNKLAQNYGHVEWRNSFDSSRDEYIQNALQEWNIYICEI
jgi:hypothetical protein